MKYFSGARMSICWKEKLKAKPSFLLYLTQCFHPFPSSETEPFSSACPTSVPRKPHPDFLTELLVELMFCPSGSKLADCCALGIRAGSQAGVPKPNTSL